MPHTGNCGFPRRTLLGNTVNKREGPRLLRPGPHAAAWGARALDGGDVPRLHPLLALRRLVGDLLAFFKRLESAATYSAVMYEEVFATLIRGDEAVALVLVEPLDRSLRHILKPPFLVPGAYQIKSRPHITAGGASLTIPHLRLHLDLTTSGAGAALQLATIMDLIS